jgi:Spy/CpxP family protein refolding chaperone
MRNRFDARPGVMAGALLALAVAVGFLAGIATDRLLLVPRASFAAEPAPRAGDDPRLDGRGERGERIGPGRMGGGRYLEVVARELELTDEQRARLDEILREQQARMAEITRETRPRMQEVARDTREAIHNVLTPEQKARFEELRGQRDRRMGPREGVRRPRPDGPERGARPGASRAPRVEQVALT